MYVGRIVAVGRTAQGANTGMYRVSSRSFPNRMAVEVDGRIAIVPRPGHEGDVHKNPYIAYNCVRIAADCAVVTNGSHTDPIAEKLDAGMAPRDALVLTLLTMDYEKDAYDTPRIAAVVPSVGDEAWLGVVRRDALVTKAVALTAGHALWISTYEGDDVRDRQRTPLAAGDAPGAARAIVDGPGFVDLEKPVTSAAAVSSGGGFALATHVVE